jgi:hypothetical protein
MIKRDILIVLTTVPVILAPSIVSAQTQPNIVVPTIEFAGNSTAFTIKVTTDPTQQFLIGPVVITRDRFILNGGTFNPLDLNVNIPVSESINPIGQSTLDATVGKIGISSKTLFGVASGSSDFDRVNFPSRSPNANTGLTVGGDDPILTIP